MTNQHDRDSAELRIVCAQRDHYKAALAIESTRCIAAVQKALADWPQVPSESTKRFAAMVIANIEGKS